jgi:hypothetical protein
MPFGPFVHLQFIFGSSVPLSVTVAGKIAWDFFGVFAKDVGNDAPSP